MPDTRLWMLYCGNSIRIFCDLCQMDDATHPQSEAKLWNEGVYYRPETLHGNIGLTMFRV